MNQASLFASPQRAISFWLGSLAVAAGVALHIPMFLMGRKTGFRMVGMPMTTGMLMGMALIVIGVGAAAFGLLPRRRTAHHDYGSIVSPEDTPLTTAHWIQIALLAVALVIDVMKASSLGFVVPGMRVEYGLTSTAVAILPFCALVGTTAGSFLWGFLADLYGRRASILLAAVMFVGTSICGAMPSFAWNIFMCFMMGLAAGGMLPVANALLAEIMPTRHRGWCLVLIGGIGTIGGYFATSALSALLQPHFGWRIMWLLGFPTGVALIVLSPLLPESARFLLEMGRVEEARQMLARYGASLDRDPGHSAPAATPATPRDMFGLSAALTVAALAWGLVNFGILLWLPASLVAEGRSVGLSSAIIARSALIGIPTVIAATYLYSFWSTKKVLLLAIGITVLGLLATLLRHRAELPLLSDPAVSVTLLVVGAAAVISILMPYAAESFAVKQRGRATGWVAGCSKIGGVLAQGLAAFAFVPAFAPAAGAIAIPAVASLFLIAVFGHETRGLDLRQLEH